VPASLSSTLGTGAAAAADALGIPVEAEPTLVTIAPPGAPDGGGAATAQWAVWVSCAALGAGWYLVSGLLGLAEARTLRRADMLSGTRLQYLPQRLQFSAGVACSRLDEAEVEISWAGQPVLLVAALVPVLLWLLAMVCLAALNGTLPSSLEVPLLLLPVAITLPLLAHVRRVQGTLYLLTARGAVELRLQCACLGGRDAPRRTRYGQMLALPVVRSACHQPRCADLLFAAAPSRGERGFRCLPTAVASSLQHLLRERVAALPPGEREVTGAVVLPALVEHAAHTELSAVAVAVEAADAVADAQSAQGGLSTPPLATSTHRAPPMDKPAAA